MNQLCVNNGKVSGGNRPKIKQTNKTIKICRGRGLVKSISKSVTNKETYSGGVTPPNTPGTAGGPGGRDRTLAVKS